MGGDKVAEILGQLKALMGSFTGGGKAGATSSSDTSRDVSDMARSLASGQRLTAKMASDMDKISSISKDMAKANKVMGGNILGKEGGSASFWKQNQHLLQQAAAATSGGGEEDAASKKFREQLSEIKLELAENLVTLSPSEKASAFGIAAESVRDLISANPDLSQTTQNNTLRTAAAYDRMSLTNDDKDQRNTAARLKHQVMEAAKLLKDDNTFKKDMSFLMMPLFNPGSMWATLFSGRQTFSALNTATGSSFLKNNMGGMGAGMATGVLVAAATAVGLALKALGAVVSETTKAFENARQLYAKALTSGMGLGFTAKRSMVANIMGVSETEVFRFGAQMAYLNPRLQQASEILAKTARPLTQVSWEFKILLADLSATFSEIANQATPALMGFIDALDLLIKKLNDHPNLINWGLAVVSPSIAYYKMVGQGLGHLLGTDKAQSKMPGITSWMKQLPASSWEKMGLQVGPNANNYAKQTAQNTRSMAKDLSTVARFILSHGGTVSNTPGAQFGLSMIQNAP